MPPKKDAAAADGGIAGYDLKETKLIAAAFLSSVGPDKVCTYPCLDFNGATKALANLTDITQYDYTLFAKLSGFTEGTLRKFWPPVKKKAIENHENFGAFLAGGVVAAPASKVTSAKKRKVADADIEVDPEPESGFVGATDIKSKRASRGKKVKTEAADDGAQLVDEANSADGGDSMGEFAYRRNVEGWLERTDRLAEEV